MSDHYDGTQAQYDALRIAVVDGLKGAKDNGFIVPLDSPREGYSLIVAAYEVENDMRDDVLDNMTEALENTFDSQYINEGKR